MIRSRFLPLGLVAALLLAGFAAAWHGAGHASLEAHQELCGLCSIGGQLGTAVAPDTPQLFEWTPFAARAESAGTRTLSRAAFNFLARGPPRILA